MSTLYVDNLQPNLGSQVEIPNLKPLAGSVLQVQSYKMPTGQISSSGNNTWLNTGCNVSITPTSTSNKVLVILSASTLANGTASYAVRVQRNGTVINLHEMYNNDSVWQGDSVSLVCLDSPASTSSVAYTVDMLAQTGSSAQMRFNYMNGHGSTSTITAIEIAG